MTDPATFIALAERCEQAAGPDAGLDLAMWTTFLDTPGFQPLSPWRTDYTASLDAAVTLVPEGYYWQAANGKRRHSEPQACADLFVAHGPNRGDMSFTADAATAALALCAAALRARAAMLHPAG
jgi:hypothetical protein